MSTAGSSAVASGGGQHASLLNDEYLAIKKNDSRDEAFSTISSCDSKSDYYSKLSYIFRSARFFIINSTNSENIILSKAKGVWSFTRKSEPKFNHIYQESNNVILIFTLKKSGKFAGFARLSSESCHTKIPICWVLPPGLSAGALDSVVKIDWICRKKLIFSRTKHLYSEGRPLRCARNGQEVNPRVAEELCRLFPYDEGIDLIPIMRKSMQASRNVRAPLQRPIASVHRGGGMNSDDQRRRGNRASYDSYDNTYNSSYGNRGGQSRTDMGRDWRQRYPEEEFEEPRSKRNRTGPAVHERGFDRKMLRDRSPNRYLNREKLIKPPVFESAVQLPRYYTGVPLPEEDSPVKTVRSVVIPVARNQNESSVDKLRTSGKRKHRSSHEYYDESCRYNRSRRYERSRR